MIFLEDDNPFSELDILICNCCGFSFAYPYPDNNALDSFYRNIYGKHKLSPFYERAILPTILCQKPKIGIRELSQILLGLQFQENVGNFLDIGAGPGNAFPVIKNINAKWKLYAVEEDPASNQLLKQYGVTIVNPIGHNIELDVSYKKFFDFILMSHALEHFNGRDILSILQNITSLMKKKAVLVIEVPNDDFTLYAEKRINDTPHLSFFL